MAQEQTTSSVPLPSLDQIEHVLQTLFTSTDANLQNEANRWLLDLQGHSQIAMVCFELIKEDRSFYSQIYGIQTIYSKIHQDWESRWSDELKSQIRSTLFNRFLTDDSKSTPLLYSKICCCISAIIIHSIPKLWSHPLGDLVSLIGSTQSSDRIKRGAIEILTQLPQEYGNVVLSNARRLAIKEYFTQRSEPIIFLISTSLEHSTNRNTNSLLIKCLSFWIDFSNAKVLRNGNVLNNLFKVIDDDELFQEGISLINDLINFHTYISPYSEKEPANARNIHSDDDENYTSLVIPIINKLVSKKDLFIKSEKYDNIMTCRSFADILSQIVECYTPKMLQVNRPECQQVLGFLMDIVSHKERELSEITFDAWIYLGEHIGQLDDDVNREPYHTLYAHLLAKLLQKSSYPNSIDRVDYNDELATEISSYRANVSDVVLCCFEILQVHFILAYIENLLKKECKNWQSFEVVIFLFRCIHTEVMEEDDSAGSIISHSLTLPVHPTLSNTILKMIDEYGDYIFQKSDLLDQTFSFIISLIKHKDLRPSALNVLKLYCEKYGDRLYKNIDQSLAILDSQLGTFTTNEQKDFIESILLLSSYLEYEMVPNILQRALTPVIYQLKSVLEIELPQKEKCTLIIDRLSLLESSLKIPDEYFNIFKDFVNNVWSLCSSAHDFSLKFGDLHVLEALYKVITLILIEMGDEEYNLEKIFNFIMHDINSFPCVTHHCFETINILIQNFSKLQKCHIYFTNITNLLSTKCIPIMTNNNNESIPVISRFYKTMTKFLESCPQIIYNTQHVVPIIELSIVALRNMEKDSVMSIVDFLSKLFINSQTTHDALVSKYAFHILSNLLLAIAQDSSKHMTTYFANLLRSWIDKYKGDATNQIIKDTILKATWISVDVSSEDRERLAKLITSITNAARFKALINDLVDVCNNHQTWDVFLSYELSI